MTNDTLWQKDVTEGKLKEPESCDKTCVRFPICSFPANCRIKIKEAKRNKDKAMEKRYQEHLDKTLNKEGGKNE